MGSNLARPINPWISLKAIHLTQGSVTLRAYQYEDETVYEVKNTYTGKSMLSLTRMFAEWLFEACEKNLIGARA